jgi:hypothetical protein
MWTKKAALISIVPHEMGTLKSGILSAAFSARQVNYRTFSLVKSLHLSAEWIMKPSNCSGADAILDDCSVFNFFDAPRAISGAGVTLYRPF